MALWPDRKEARGANDTLGSLFLLPALFFHPPSLHPSGLHRHSFFARSPTPFGLLVIADSYTCLFSLLSLGCLLLHSNTSWQDLALQLQPSPRLAARASQRQVYCCI